VIELQDIDIKYLTAAGDVSAAITSDGDLYTWGNTKGGGLGTGSQSFTTNLMQPTLVNALDMKFK
jgi:alpha-tubulin suppressor-like RCC1 family protein